MSKVTITKSVVRRLSSKLDPDAAGMAPVSTWEFATSVTTEADAATPEKLEELSQKLYRDVQAAVELDMDAEIHPEWLAVRAAAANSLRQAEMRNANRAKRGAA